MPLKLTPPKAGRTPFWRIRGTYLKQYVDRSTGVSDRATAKRALDKIKAEIQCGSFATPGAATFASAAMIYARAGGEWRYLDPLLKHFGERPLASIEQPDIDAAASVLYPNASPATRNRQIYTPISAILKRAGFEKPVKRPVGWRGTPRLHWLRPDDAFAVLEAATRLNARFGALCTFLLYTGARGKEARDLAPADLHLSEGYAYLRDTKNGEPQAVHLPPVVVAALAGLDLTGATVFGFENRRWPQTLLVRSFEAAGVPKPPGIALHIFRHSFGAWMKRGGADLTRVGRWKDAASTRVYDHVEVAEEARKADFLPTRRKA